MASSPEQFTATPERREIVGLQFERQEQLASSPEKSVETTPSPERAEQARLEAMETAISVEAAGLESQPKPRSATPGGVGKQARQQSFKRTMDDVQAELSAPSRLFSKTIHIPVVEATSEALGRTVARPNAIVAGSFSALALTFGLYMIAKYYGYPLSGFETIGAFMLGWLIGMAYDYIKLLITGRR